ncbi:MAG: capsule assembly Wzi family protein [Candidatus Cloacimonadota bacterium]|nr:capsule assembly Wzi family protein [Candidatus Cloacimonadota bacterium]
MKKYIILILILFVFNILSSQVVLVPLNDDVYDFLEILEIKGLLGKSFLDIKPLSRKDVATFLLKTIDNPNYKNLPSSMKVRLLEYLKKYNYEKHFVDEDLQFIEILEEGLSLLTQKKVSLSKPDSIKKWKPLHFPYKFQNDNCFLQFNPTVLLEYSYNSSDSNYFAKDYTKITAGARIFGYLGNHIGFGFRAVNNRIEGNEFDLMKTDCSAQGVGSLVTRGTFYDEVDAYISHSSKYVELVFGKFANYWGSGKTGSISISNRAPSYPQIMLKTGFSDWLKFVYFHGWLESNELDDSSSYVINYGNDHEFERKFYKSKYIAAHRLDIFPFANLKIGLSEILYYGETRPKIIYLIPIMFFWSAQHQTNDQDNEEIGIDIEWLPTNYCKFYGSMIIDDIRLTKIFSENESLNYFGYQLGAFFFDPYVNKLDFRIEYTRINPWVYTHKFPVNCATSDGYQMGYWAGQNSDNLYLELGYKISESSSLDFIFSHYRKGAQDSIFQQYEIPPAEKFMYGHQYTKNTFGINLEFKILSQIRGEIGYTFLKCDVNEKNIAKAEQGIYVNPVYYTNDFYRNSIRFSVGYGFK